MSKSIVVFSMAGVRGELPRDWVSPKEREAAVLRFWAQNQIYVQSKKLREKGPKFFFLDGPPFPSSETPHIGTCWNKIIKDVIIRYKRARGYNVRDQPGYDCHGLPIELAVEKKFNLKSKRDIENFTVEKFVEECRAFASANLDSMSRVFSNLGVWMDWECPYITHNNEFIESAWWTIKKAYEDGLLENGKKVVHWCPRCATVLSDYEVVMAYETVKDPSIYVKFPLKGRDREYVVIWTTTPWTLPCNVAVMVHPDFEYSKVRLENDKLLIAKERIPILRKELQIDLEVGETVVGAQLDKLSYLSPLADLVDAQRNLDNGHRIVVNRDYVTLEEGTGCVHVAPGHGEEDYDVGIKNGLPTLMLVDDDGRFVPEAGKYNGMHIRSANEVIIADLGSKGLLMHSTEIQHRSAVCWRCKTPLILRATDQWFLKVTKFKETMLSEVDSAMWIPAWAGSTQFKNWLHGLRDWVISRQRFWGTPLPVWRCSKCARVEIPQGRSELALKSSNENIPDLHVPWVDKIIYDCPCGGAMSRVPDVLVGWFDSGIASYASLGYPNNLKDFEYWWPADFIVEGRDQISGWFFSLLKAGLIAFETRPFKTVLMHGFLLDEQGREMHKSSGNFVVPDDMVNKYGRDALRMYLLQTTTWEDIKFSERILEGVSRDLNSAWNVYVFASTYMRLDSFRPSKWPLEKMARSLRPEDRWIISVTENLVKTVTNSLEQYKLYEAARAILKFLLEDLSRNYIRLIRRRTWIERPQPDKMAAYSALYHALRTSAVLISPIIPFMAEAAYQGFLRDMEDGNAASVTMVDWLQPNEQWVDFELEKSMDDVKLLLSSIAEVRMNAKLKLRQPVREIIVVSDSPEVKKAASKFRHIIREQGNCRKLTVIGSTAESRRRLRKPKLKINFESIRRDFPEEAKTIFRKLEGFPAGRLEQSIIKHSSFQLEVDGQLIRLGTDHITVVGDPKLPLVCVENPRFRVYIDTHLTKNEISEGTARDIVRRIQQMRKEAGMEIEAFVNVHIVTSSKKSTELLYSKRAYICGEVRAKKLVVSRVSKAEPTSILTKVWTIGQEKFIISLAKA